MIIPALGIAFSVFLISQCTPVQIAVGVLLLLVGVPIYIKYSPKHELSELKQAIISREATLGRVYDQEHVFLAHLILHIKRAYQKARQGKRRLPA